MRRAGDHMRVSVQLVDARNGYQIWSSEYDRPFEDAIRIQEDISRSVAESLAIRLTDDTIQRFAARSTKNPEAYRLFLLGVTNSRIEVPKQMPMRSSCTSNRWPRIRNLRLPTLAWHTPRSIRSI